METRKKEYEMALQRYHQLPEKTKTTMPPPKEPDYGVQYAKKGDTVEVHYIGYLKDGNVEFDNSYKRDLLLEFTVGVGQVALIKVCVLTAFCILC